MYLNAAVFQCLASLASDLIMLKKISLKSLISPLLNILNESSQTLSYKTYGNHTKGKLMNL